jgi:D-erythrulose 1-phosphate 3-epimerase
MRTEMHARLGINNCFAVKRWPHPDDWASIVSNDLGLDTVELSLDLLAGPDTAAGRDRLTEQTRVALVRHGLRADTVFTGLAAYSLNLLMHPDAEHRAAARRWYREAIYLTAQLGAAAVGGHVGALTVPDSADPARRAERWADLRQNLAGLADYAHQCGLDHLLVENLVTDREPSTMALIEDIVAERAVARAPVQLCLDLGHPFVCGGSPQDRDPYAWLEHFGPRIAEVQLQQSDGLADHHWPFTPERNAAGLVDPGRVLDTLAGAGVTDVLLILEVIPPFEQDDRQVIGDLRASADLWRRALAERGLAERGPS